MGISTKYGYCHKCPNTKLQDLSSCIGDPEGIRNDQKCPKCSAIYGCTKAHQRMLGKYDLPVLQSERGSLGKIKKKS